MNTLAARRHNTQATRSLRTGFMLSGLVHVGFVAVLAVLGMTHDAPRPPVYRVELVGAPKGERQAGVVTPAATEAPKKAEAPAGAERAPVEKAMPTKKVPVAPTPKATPSPTRSKAAGDKAPAVTAAKALPKAGSGSDGGTGADVKNIRTEGIAFPFPAYTDNIVRKITLAYTPKRVSATLVAEVKFLIRRDGSVADIQIVKSSGDRVFDGEAMGTVEAVGSTRGFGPLPSGWADDVLVVYFTFDYALRPS